MAVSPEQLRQSLRSAPFQPFRIHLADQRSFEVPHPEFAALSPTGRTVLVFSAGSELAEQIDVPLIVSIGPIDDPSTKAA